MAEPTCRLTASTCRLAASRRTNASPGRAALHAAWPRQQPAASQRGTKNTPNQAQLGPPNRALLQQPIRGFGTGAPKTFSDNVTPVRNAVMGRENDGRASSNLPPRHVSLPRPRGVTVSTLDSESSDRGSNPREASATVNLATPRLHAERLNAAGAENLHSGLDAVGACPWMTHPVRACGATKAWTHWGLNPGPSACEADVIPLHRVPAGAGRGDARKLAGNSCGAFCLGRAARNCACTLARLQLQSADLTFASLLTARKDLRVLPAFRFEQDYSLCNRQRKPEHAAFPVAGGNTVSGAACRVA